MDRLATPVPDRAAEVIAQVALRGETLACAESLTGGLIGATLTAVPGASAVFRGGVISYATEVKTSLLAVPAEVVAAHSVISAEVVGAMASGVLSIVDADWAIAVSGVAGPDPQDGHAPGEVWLAVVHRGQPPATRRRDFSGNRDKIRDATVDAALAFLLERLPPV